MNLPNKLTLLRVIMIPFFVFALMMEGGANQTYRCIAAAIFIIARSTNSTFRQHKREGECNVFIAELCLNANIKQFRRITKPHKKFPTPRRPSGKAWQKSGRP